MKSVACGVMVGENRTGGSALPHGGKRPVRSVKANGATIAALCEQVAGLTEEVRTLAAIVRTRPASYTALIGWKQIGAYLGKSARTAMRYGQCAGLPSYRVGRPRISSGALIDAWGMVREKDRPRWRKYREERSRHASG